MGILRSGDSIHYIDVSRCQTHPYTHQKCLRGQAVVRHHGSMFQVAAAMPGCLNHQARYFDDFFTQYESSHRIHETGIST